MFPKRRSKNYDSPSDGELQGNYTVVSDGNNTNNSTDDGKDHQMNTSSSSCQEVSAVETRQKPTRQSLPNDVMKEKRTSLSKRLSFRLFESKGKKKQLKETVRNEVSELTVSKENGEDIRQGVDSPDAEDDKETVVCNRDSSLLEEILAETGQLGFNMTEQKK